jgi:hypothetical protein
MFYTNAVNVNFEILREVAFGDIDATFTVIGTLFTHDIIYLDIYNGTNQDIILSKDGTNNAKRLPSGAIWVWDIGSNQWTVDKPALFKKGEGLYQKYASVAPTSGLLSLTAVYGS